MMKWTHDDLAADLASHLRGNSERMVWTDMQMGPAGSKRPDVYTIPIRYASFTPLSYECKISVADFRRDITAGKWQSYLKFSAGVVFAVPAGLIRKEDVPPGCGLIVRSESGWRSAKGPTMQHIDTLPREAWMKLLIDGVDRVYNALQTKQRPAHEWHAQEQVRKKYGESIAQALANRDRAADLLDYETRRIEGDIADMRKRRQERLEQERKKIDEEAGPLNQVRTELTAALGLPANASLWLIQEAARDAIDRLQATGEIKHVHDELRRAESSLQRALDNVRQAMEPNALTAAPAVPMPVDPDSLDLEPI